jgi:hypothetical protein
MGMQIELVECTMDEGAHLIHGQNYWKEIPMSIARCRDASRGRSPRKVISRQETRGYGIQVDGDHAAGLMAHKAPLDRATKNDGSTTLTSQVRKEWILTF